MTSSQGKTWYDNNAGPSAPVEGSMPPYPISQMEPAEKPVAAEPPAFLKEVEYEDPVDVQETIINEGNKDVVYEVKPYFSHSILTATFFVYYVWTIFYFAFRAGWTLNNNNPATYIYSVIFLLVEFVSFLGSALHYNNFTTITTNILVQTLPQVLTRVKKEFPLVATFICCYKEPHHIVARTMACAMAMDYPPDRLTVGILDDSANFRESRGWVHVQSMEKNFLECMLRRATYRVFNGGVPSVSLDEDPRGILAPAADKIQQSIRDSIESEVSWFVEYYLLNTWSHASDCPRTPADLNNERELIAELRSDEFNPYRTFTEDDLDNINKFTVEGLQLLWHGSAFFRPIVRRALFQRSGIKEYIQKLNAANELRYLTPHAIALTQYRVLCLGRENVPNEVVSAGNVRIDFEPTGTILAPRTTYIRRRKPPVPHNKAGNINNALFNESTSGDFEFIMLLDADQQPHRDFLQRTLPYFFSEGGHNIAFIQTPQFFNNIFPADDPLGHRNMEFYGPVMECRGHHGAAPFVGTNAIFARAKLCEVGGIMYNSVTEDMYTGMKLHGQGYKSLYHNEVLAVGSAPVDLKETLEQRKRWAQGAVEIFTLTPWAHIIKTVGLRKAMYNLDSCVYPFMSPTAFFYGVSPFIMVIWQVPIVVEDPVLFVLVGLFPVMILPRIIQYMVLRATRPHEENRSAPALWVEATDMWRAEQTYFSFAGTYINAWHAGRESMKRLRMKHGVKGSLAMWNWNRDFLKPKDGEHKKPAKKVSEQQFRTSIKESDQIKNTKLFVANVALFLINCVSLLLGALRFNCDTSQIWIFVVVMGFSFSTCWHLWSFIPMALRQNENQWPYASSFHAHNLLLMFVLGFLVFLFVKVKVCIYQYVDMIPGSHSIH